MYTRVFELTAEAAWFRLKTCEALRVRAIEDSAEGCRLSWT